MEKWYFNGVDLCSKAWFVESVISGLGTPAVRGDNIQVPFMHGKRYRKKRFESKTIILSMWVVGLNPETGLYPTDKEFIEQFDTNVNTLTRLFGKNGQFQLVRQTRDGKDLIAMAEIIKDVVFIPKYPGYAKFAVEFDLADPFFYPEDYEESTITITSSPQTINIDNPGTAETNSIIVKLHGPLANPRITNENNGIWIQFQGSVALGEMVVIDMKDYSCVKSSFPHEGETENFISGIKHGGDMNWLALEAGANILTVTSDVTSGEVEILYYPAYF